MTSAAPRPVLRGAVGAGRWRVRPPPCQPPYPTQLLDPCCLATIRPPLPRDTPPPFCSSSALVFAKPSSSFHIPSHFLPLFALQASSFSSSRLTHPLTCRQTVSLLPSVLGCVNAGLAFPRCRGVRADWAVSGQEHGHQADGESQGNHGLRVTHCPPLLSSTRCFCSSPLFSKRSQDFPRTPVLLRAHCDITGFTWRTKMSQAFGQNHCGLCIICG